MNVGVPTIDVRHLVPADPIKTQWFERLVNPAAAACRFEKGPPGVNLMPLQGPVGRYEGEADSFNRRWCVTLSSSCQFWRKPAVLHTYLHECAHLLVYDQHRRRDARTPGHGPIFLLIQLVLFHRVDRSCPEYNFSIFNTACLYDFHESAFNESVPEYEWRSSAFSFAIKHYRHLAESDLSAEAVAKVAFDLWAQWTSEIRATEIAREKHSKELVSLRARVTELERQRDASASWRLLFMTVRGSAIAVGGSLAVTLGMMVFALAYNLGLQRAFT